ncbi:MAG TPA: hypothetical protein VLF94_03595 [Chlamydiales bacterium]|nr:hypothetical protein [Chlamydiales bacterium]
MVADEAREAGELVYAAFCRAFSAGQLARVEQEDLDHLLSRKEPLFVVFVDPPKGIFRFFQAARSHPAGVKMVLFGKLPFSIAEQLGVHIRNTSEDFSSDAASESAPAGCFRESRLRICYRRTLGSLSSPIFERAFLRYDFAKEWNHLGYGAIRLDCSPWALSQWADAPQTAVLADVVRSDEVLSTYAAGWDEEHSSVLWFNRAVGPIDSQEWRLVEHFFASYRHVELPCLPVFSEIPYGWDAAVTMRLDCDEEIASARGLFEQYRAWNVPFSLAIHTSILKGSSHVQMVQDVIKSRGAILSHSHTHPSQWGGSYQMAFQQAEDSSAAINDMLGKDLSPLYAVSPFHQTPSYALRALSDANYLGCIGGTISSDPEFLLARGGHVLGCPPGFIGHSQSCMLHGDCLLSEGDPLRIYKDAFLIALRGRGLFGFLDHPFSKRYSYGWQSESQRTEVHRQWIEFIRSQGRVLFLNEQDVLDFIRYKSSVNINLNKNGEIIYQASFSRPNSELDLAVELAGRLVNLTGG